MLHPVVYRSVQPVASTLSTATSKRVQQTDVIIEATLEALRKYGYASTSLQRIAEEAGTSKRMVLHYFQTRDQLFDAVVTTVCGRILDQVEEAMSDQPNPAAALSDGLDKVWEAILADPSLQAVFFGLLAESVADPAHRSTIAAVRDEYRRLIARVVAGSMGEDPDSEHPETIATLVLAAMAGLTVDFLERGDTPALRRAFDDFKQSLAARVVASAEAQG
jgi:TetR/AcrR family transcriptional regulator, transcriptional repressor of bet genes